MRWLTHIADEQALARAQAEDAPYAPPSLASEGFVHASYREQLTATLERHFADAARVTLLWVDTEALPADARVVVEDTTGHGAFPHIYGAIPLAAVGRIDELTRHGDRWTVPAPPDQAAWDRADRLA